jgi:agmatinase
MVELCPIENEKSSDFLAAKLFYKMLSYKFAANDNTYDNGDEVDGKNPFSKLSKFKSDDDGF